MGARFKIEETPDGWRLRQSGVEGKHVDLDVRKSGFVLIVTPDNHLNATLTDQLPKEQTNG